jgi:hypothetical protein
MPDVEQNRHDMSDLMPQKGRAHQFKDERVLIGSFGGRQAFESREVAAVVWPDHRFRHSPAMVFDLLAPVHLAEIPKVMLADQSRRRSLHQRDIQRGMIGYWASGEEISIMSCNAGKPGIERSDRGMTLLVLILRKR